MVNFPSKRKRRASTKLHGLYSSWDVKGRIVTVNTSCHSRDLHGILAPLHICCALYFTLEKINTHWDKGWMSLYYSGKRSCFGKEKKLHSPKSINMERWKIWRLNINRTDWNTEYPLVLGLGNSFGYIRSAQVFSYRRRKFNLDKFNLSRLTSSATGEHKDHSTISSVESRLPYPFLLLQVPDITFHFVLNGTLNRMG